MTVDERRSTSLNARFCLKCFDKDVTFNAWHYKNCTVNKTHKLPNTCVKYPKCTIHAWVCPTHKDANKFKMTEFTKKFKINPPVNTNTATTEKTQCDFTESTSNTVKPGDEEKCQKKRCGGLRCS